MDILWRRRSRVSKAKHLKGCIKKLLESSLVGGGGGREVGWAGGGRGWEGSRVGWSAGGVQVSVRAQKGFQWESMNISQKTKLMQEQMWAH